MQEQDKEREYYRFSNNGEGREPSANGAGPDGGAPYAPRRTTPENGTCQDDAQDLEDELKRGRRRGFIGGLLAGLLIMALLVGAVYAGVRRSVSGGAQTPDGSAGVQSGDGELLDAETERKLRMLKQSVDAHYYKRDVTLEEQRNGLYHGLIDSLNDPYSVYYTREDLEALLDQTEGIYYGIGAYISVDQSTNTPIISGIIPGTPAEEAGILTGDYIYEVDGESVLDMTTEEIANRIKGPEGTTVHIVFLRGSEGKEIALDVTRRRVESPTVEYKMLDDGIGYLQIMEFDDVTYDQFMEGMEALRAEGMKALVLDLRGNPGGNLSTVCDIAEQLLPKGVIVYTMDRDGNREDYNSSGRHRFDLPLTVLVNDYSASASEILAGAIQDYGIGVIVGTQTYGKGVVQSIYTFNDGTAVKLTVSNYYTPNGNDINGIGISPDLEVEFDSDAYAEDDSDNQLDAATALLWEELGLAP